MLLLYLFPEACPSRTSLGLGDRMDGRRDDEKAVTSESWSYGKVGSHVEISLLPESVLPHQESTKDLLSQEDRTRRPRGGDESTRYT